MWAEQSKAAGEPGLEPDLSAGKPVANPVTQINAKKKYMYRIEAVLELNATISPEVITIKKK